MFNSKPIRYFHWMAYCLLGYWLVVMLLSLSHQLTLSHLRIGTCVVFISFFIVQRKFLHDWAKQWAVAARSQRWLSGYIVLLFTLTFFQGVVAAPSTTDTMTYHMPRILYWLGERTVFQHQIFTSNDFLSPFADYVMMGFFALFGDRGLFLTQWVSGIGCLLVVREIARRLHATRSQQSMAVWWAATIPGLALQLSSTQVELFVSLCIVLITVLVLDAVHDARSLMLVPLMIALAITTKMTVIFFLPLWVLLLISPPYSIQNWWVLWRSTMGGICGAIIIMVPYVLQNLWLYGKPLGILLINQQLYSMTNEVISPAVFFINLVRNFLLHIPLLMFAQPLTVLFEQVGYHMGMAVNDPRITWMGTTFRVSPLLFPQEDVIGNPLHLVLFLGVVGMTFWGFLRRLFRTKRTQHMPPIVFKYVLGIVAFFALFSLVLKWQPWHTRLHLPAFFLMSVMIGIVFQARHILIKSVLALSAGLSVVLVLLNVAHPYLSYVPLRQFVTGFTRGPLPEPFYRTPRAQQYFTARPEWYAVVKTLIEELPPKGIGSLCVSLEDGYFYPLYTQLRFALKEPVVIRQSCDQWSADLEIISAKDLPAERQNTLRCLTSVEGQTMCVRWRAKVE